ncbi:hypothetical protein L3Q67_44715 [Saccharothrix sp. AJ9571]|nr:hypothetical protein L3Q67_44715 [Saccharothrix sp. AJ9571]
MRKEVRLGAAALVLCSLAACGTPDGTPAAPPPPPTSTPAPPPTPDQVAWLNEFCEATQVFFSPPQPPEDLRDEFVAMDLDTYLSSVSSALQSVDFRTTSLAPERFPRGAELVDAYTKTAEELSTKFGGYARQFDVAEDTLRGWVTEVSSTLKTLKPQGLDLATLSAADGTVAQAHQQAEKCRPTKEEEGKPSATPVDLPAAKDGENLAACGDGRCEVLVTPTAVVPAPRRYGFTLVRVRSISGGVMQVGAKFDGGAITSPLDTGRSTIMNGLEVKAVAVGDGKAVLSFSPG